MTNKKSNEIIKTFIWTPIGATALLVVSFLISLSITYQTLLDNVGLFSFLSWAIFGITIGLGIFAYKLAGTIGGI